MASKYSADTERVEVEAAQARSLVRAILVAKGCPQDIAEEVAEHVIESDWSGVESHGTWRILPYAGYYDSGYLKPDVRPELKQNAKGAWIVDGLGGIGIPAMSIATRDVVERAKATGMAAIALHNVGHTGRLGAFAEEAAKQGCLIIIIGGGGRKNWRPVAPYGGRKALMSTNPCSIGIPGGDRGPVVVDFATSAAAAGWVYGAKIAGAHLPEGVLIDKEGAPTTDPQDYFDGGAILTAGGAKGYALSVAAEMIAEALLGPATTECNWLMLAMDCSLYREPTQMQSIAEEILDEFRNCPPAAGFDRVEIPGEREADARVGNQGKPISLPLATWKHIIELADDLDVPL
ncbi:Ldh family oxidoreductase [Tropicibacter sp. R16_0]|uniref:Ldh family oxidoreductase n=1 Tax=Tropicibacter sp. R16_0 TaxID=2821102 RepID=UPI001ADA6237|nr:Ldh family oxidoreductase [Tropicibacter sp. R16_0]MBO9452835.1 Ldh family oxidoreductase [Tropicibacter sp. R16_0]